ncbi:MAG: hypothetical protein KA275_07490 [Chitinophagaceae bacterium]|nr:hypothetical protein [Chitinophagaceae bacterium]
MKNIFLLIFIISFFNFNANAEKNEFGIKLKEVEMLGGSGYYSSPVYFGGSIGFQPFEKAYLFSIAPILAARIQRRTHLGISPTYQYYREKIVVPITSIDSTTHILEASSWNVSVFLRYFYYNRFFLHLEPELINYKEITNLYYDNQQKKVVEVSSRNNTFALLTGLGYVQPIGEQSIFVITVLYDVLQQENTPYEKLPFIRGSFNLGF